MLFRSLELDVASGLVERSGGLGVVPPPGPHPSAVTVADGADGVVADVQAGQFAEQSGGPLERPLGSGDAQEPLRVRADQAVDAEAVIERVGVGSAASAGEMAASERHVAGGGDEPPLGLAVAPPWRAAGAGPAAPPFFSRSAA